MLSGKTLLDYGNSFSFDHYKKNDKIIYKYFKNKYFKSWGRLNKRDETRSYLLEKNKT